MAIVTKAPPSWNRAESQRRVTHPLQRLRGYIRLYVSAEGLAVFCLYLSLWFWLGLVADYGFFKAFGVDWVQELPRGVRVAVLGILVTGLLALVTVKVLLRLLREFQNAALALVLERRFPGVLGDRLITAVEMADLNMAQRYGYSQAMIDQTVRDAGENVASVPVNEVFNWRRLWRYAAIVAGLTVGLYVLIGLGYCAVNRTAAVTQFMPRFADVAEIWLERNILLRDTLWPRRTYLVLVNFPGEELRVGRDTPPPSLRVRALKWVVADPDRQQAPEGWRALRWHELPAWLNRESLPTLPAGWQVRRRPEFLALWGAAPQASFPASLSWSALGLTAQVAPAVSVDEIDLQLEKFKVRHAGPSDNMPARWVIADNDHERAPNGWRALRWDDLKPELLSAAPRRLPSAWKMPDEGAGATADEVETKLDQPAVRNALDADTLLALRGVFTELDLLASLRRDVFDDLDRLADSPHMSRRLRKLVIPEEVVVVLKGATVRGLETMQKHDNNEFTVTLSELRESIQFRARAEDYATPYRKITVVPPPDLVELLVDEDQPAYLYHRPPRGGTLKELRGLKQKFRGRPVSLTVENPNITVPAGTDLVLTAKTDKSLQQGDGVRLVPFKGVELDVPTRQIDDHTFQVRFANVSAPIELLFELLDTDRVTSQRHISIKPIIDQPPEAEVQVEVLRKTPQGAYLCTPWALVPFSGKVRDDRGLSDAEYAYRLTRMASMADSKVQALALLGKLKKIAAEDDKAPETQVRLGTFAVLLKERQLDDIRLPDLLTRLDQPPPTVQEVNQRLLKEFNLEDPPEFFDVGNLPIELVSENKIQPHYRLVLRLIATDNNIETGPHVNPSKGSFTLLIVSEEDLLAEISKDEEALRVKLQDAVDGLRDARTKLETVARQLPELETTEFSPMTRRAEEVGEAVTKGWNAAREVQTEYQRILKELRVNEGRPGLGRAGLINKMIIKVDDKICKPLDLAIDPDFPSADELARGFQKMLDDDQKALKGKAKDAPETRAAKEKDVQEAQRSREQLTKVIDRLQGVLDNMADIDDINRLIKRLVQIRDAEDAEFQRLKVMKKEKTDRLLEGLGTPEK